MVKVYRKRKPKKKNKKSSYKKLALVGLGGLAALGIGKTSTKIVPQPVARVRVTAPAEEKEEPIYEAAKAQVYTTVKDDSLWKISQKFYQIGLIWPIIFIANRKKIRNPNLITPGLKLDVPNITISDLTIRSVAKKAATMDKVASTLMAEVEKIAPNHPTVLQNISLNSQISQLIVFNSNLISKTLGQIPISQISAALAVSLSSIEKSLLINPAEPKTGVIIAGLTPQGLPAVKAIKKNISVTGTISEDMNIIVQSVSTPDGNINVNTNFNKDGSLTINATGLVNYKTILTAKEVNEMEAKKEAYIMKEIIDALSSSGQQQTNFGLTALATEEVFGPASPAAVFAVNAVSQVAVPFTTARFSSAADVIKMNINIAANYATVAAAAANDATIAVKAAAVAVKKLAIDIVKATAVAANYTSDVAASAFSSAVHIAATADAVAPNTLATESIIACAVSAANFAATATDSANVANDYVKDYC